MAEAFQDADIVYPKSWAPFAAMQERTELYGAGDMEGVKRLEKELLAAADFYDLGCTMAPEAALTAREGIFGTGVRS